MSLCETTLAPGLAAYQELTDAGRFCDLAPFDDNLAALCRNASGAARNLALAEADERMLCAVLCCCARHPVVSTTERHGYDTCASRTLSAAESHMGHDSRFKPQVSYNMRPGETGKPTPLMKKDGTGDLTTESIPWTPGGIQHIKNRIGQDGEPYQAGEARRPDVTIVRDPNKPPTPDNISRIVDFKFGTDTLNRKQRAAYTEIGNDSEPLILDETTCHCANEQETQGQTALISAAQTVREHDRSTLARIGWGALGLVAAVGTIALLIVPVDGPAGEIAAGTATAASFARAFAATGWTTARRQAAATLAAQRWHTLFNGGF